MFWLRPGTFCPQVSCHHCLQHPGGVERNLHVTKVSWSCTGAVLACAYGRCVCVVSRLVVVMANIPTLIPRVDDGDWSTEMAHVCTWNLLSPKLRTKQADVVIDVPAAVTALSCHPKHASLLAGRPQRLLTCSRLTTTDTCVCVCVGGLYSGRVVVWDTGHPNDPVVAQTGMSADSHREPVYEVSLQGSSINSTAEIRRPVCDMFKSNQ